MTPSHFVGPTADAAGAFHVLIPARLASTRLPNKPLADLGGQPMVVRVAQRARLSHAHRVVVATDSELIEQACLQQGIETVRTRADHPSGTDRLAEACEHLGWHGEELVVNVQGDEPLIDPALIDAVAALLQRQPQASVATAAHPITTVEDFCNPHVVKVVLDAQGQALYFSRAPIAWWRDGFKQGIAQLPSPPPLRHVGVYAYRASFLRLFPTLAPAAIETLEALEQLRALWHGHRIAVAVVPSAPAPGVDTPEDLARVRALMQAD